MGQLANRQPVQWSAAQHGPLLGGDISVGVTAVGTLVSFVVAYASIAWLLRFVAGHSIAAFVPYRVALGLLLLALLGTGTIGAT